MGMFGKSAAEYGGTSNWSDRLAILGATLKDMSPGSSGDALTNVQGLLGARAKKAQDDALEQKIMGLFGGQAQAQGAMPQATLKGPGLDGNPVAQPPSAPMASPAMTGGLNLADPNLPALVVLAKKHGFDLGQAIEVMKANQPLYHIGPDGRPYNEHDASLAGQRFGNPTVVNGQIKDLNDPANLNATIPRQAPEPTFGWRMKPDGTGLEPVPGGPASIAYQAALTGQKRDQIVARPMPQRARAAGAAASWMPPGSKPIFIPGQ